MVSNLTTTVYVKYVFSDQELLEFSRRMAQAEATISEKEDELKSVAALIKADIATQEAVLHSCAEKLRTGYEMRPKEADVKYENGVVKYVDRKTGEILEERPMTKDEQMRLTNQVVEDAEDIIRQVNEEEESE